MMHVASYIVHILIRLDLRYVRHKGLLICIAVLVCLMKQTISHSFFEAR